MRRGSTDKQWQAVKAQVFKRDHHKCRMMKVLTWRESMLLKGRESPLLTELDPAHIFPVSLFPHLIYDPENIVTLSRYFHECLDTHTDPFTGKTLSEEELEEYWIRIVGKDKFEKLKQRAYKDGLGANIITS